MTRVLGLEGTAWAASAAVFDADADELMVLETDPYEPDSGGIHPREAAEHMQAAIPSVVEAALEQTREIDAVAFSRGPGLGPCLRLCGTAARTLAQALDVPLVGVNHMLAHLEVGRHLSGFDDPVGLNASGANAHVLGYRAGRYRVLGETMDTGVGNAIDKFARHVGFGHPGGPKVEAAAAGGELLDLPYVVKGMDFSFSGLTSAAQDAVDDGADLADVCFSLQETTFAMLAEVAERALSLTGRDELVLGGGVGNNDRLRAMLAEMCDARGASFFAPEARLLGDNAGMIAILGAQMADAGDTIPVDDSAVRPDFRPDEVPVTWREGEAAGRPVSSGETVRGAEAVVTVGDRTVTKRRVPKPYRHPELDARLRRERTAAEARLLGEARRHGVPTPTVRDLDPYEQTLTLERVGEHDLGAGPTPERVAAVGRHLAALHDAGLVHGDPTTRNVRIDGRSTLIDFGLGYHSDDVEDFAMDLHVLRQSLAATATDTAALAEALLTAYRDAGEPAVLDRLEEIEGRGRYQPRD
ncbi:MAG: bifunctional N(6)-L-threonylcarbamoyladenine synthase/serine/threonine protein kinase [Halobacteriales archaeon]|nr:bifunctional N(6)-L-threonylcarbamoyladenine synthase/serine/threonine protein kinase [Halobacteriales archaeon]